MLSVGGTEQRELTSLQLVHGFGLKLSRVTASRQDGGARTTILHTASVKIPPRHLVRSDPGLRVVRGHINLMGLLDLS